jgi:hypothetical protein
MNQFHFASGKQKLPADVRASRSGYAGSGPQRDAKPRLPGLPAELPPLDLERFLPPEILGLFVSQDFLGISFRLDYS